VGATIIRNLSDARAQSDARGVGAVGGA
jgi:hypothetical protein